MDDCIFCKIVSGEVPSAKIYEDEDVFSFVDINPVNPGHTLVLPKEHFKNIYETPDEVLKKVIVVTKKMSVAVKKAVGAGGINIHVNNDRPAGQAVFHLHFHIIPRFENDGVEMWKGNPYRKGEIEEVQKKIGEALENSA